MKRILILLVATISFNVNGQSLSLVSKDSLVMTNSTDKANYGTGHMVLKNDSNVALSYYCSRSQVGTTGYVDSSYFCWDLCYPVWVDNSMGTITIGAGATSNDFSGYAYARMQDSTGQDTIWYTFINAADSSDQFTEYLVFGFDPNVGIEEAKEHQIRVYPNPAQSFVMVNLAKEMQGSLVLLDLTGREVKRQSIHAVENRMDLHGMRPGLYLLILEASGQPTTLDRLVVRP